MYMFEVCMDEYMDTMNRMKLKDDVWPLGQSTALCQFSFGYHIKKTRYNTLKMGSNLSGHNFQFFFLRITGSFMVFGPLGWVRKRAFVNDHL